jgi:transcriptional regulator with XRE-family HTH domain
MADSFGERLRKAREDRGLSQGELGQKAGLQPSAISHFESGRRSPSFDNLRRLADALSVTLDFLLGRESEARSAGPVADQLFRNFEQMSAEDQESLARFAKVLAEKNRERREGT